MTSVQITAFSPPREVYTVQIPPMTKTHCVMVSPVTDPSARAGPYKQIPNCGMVDKMTKAEVTDRTVLDPNRSDRYFKRFFSFKPPKMAPQSYLVNTR